MRIEDDCIAPGRRLMHAVHITYLETLARMLFV